jgi:predicted DNA-binding WGR domain protein
MNSTPTRFFDYKDDKSSKFWEITQAGSTVTVRYGKTGTNGQTQEDLHGSAESEEAQRPTVCISGKLLSGKKKADYQESLLAAGYELVDDVSKELSYLVLADVESTSSKSTKAKKLGIRVIDEDELNLMIIKGRS